MQLSIVFHVNEEENGIMFPDSWIKIMMAQDKTVHTLGNPRNHCLEIKCFAHNLTELESYVNPSSGDENVGWGNKATLKQNVQLQEYE